MSAPLDSLRCYYCDGPMETEDGDAYCPKCVGHVGDVDESLECLDDWNGDCEGEVAYHQNPYSDSFKAWPRCDKHYEAYIDRMQGIAQRYPVNAPSDFDPSYAGEVWSEEDY